MNVPGRKILSDEAFYTDWTPRGGDGFILRGQTIDSGGATGATNIEVKIDVQTKNTEDVEPSGVGTLLTGAITLDSTTTDEVVQKLFPPTPDNNASNTGVKEQIRLKVYANTTTNPQWLLARTFPIVWFDGA